MGIDKKHIDEILSRHPLAEGDLPAVFSREGESIAIKRDGQGAPDVTYSVNRDGKDVTLHGDEVIVREGDEFRFYKYDSAGALARAERLFSAAGGNVGEGIIDEAQRKADETLIVSARHMYSRAITGFEDFKKEPFGV